jgi:hypothetical protein
MGPGVRGGIWGVSVLLSWFDLAGNAFCVVDAMAGQLVLLLALGRLRGLQSIGNSAPWPDAIDLDGELAWSAVV